MSVYCAHIDNRLKRHFQLKSDHFFRHYVSRLSYKQAKTNQINRMPFSLKIRFFYFE